MEDRTRNRDGFGCPELILRSNLWQVDEPGERYITGISVGIFGSLTGLLALRVMQCDLDHVEVRCWRLKVDTTGTLQTLAFSIFSAVAETMAGLSIQWGNYVALYYASGYRFDHPSAVQAFPYQCDAVVSFSSVRVSAELDHRRSMRSRKSHR